MRFSSLITLVTLRVAGCDVKRLLIDQGCSSEVMYHDLLKKLELTDADLQPTNNPLVGFSSYPVWPLRKVTVPITAGGVTLQTEFLVVNVLEDKAVENLKKIYIDRHNEKYFVIGISLSKTEENSLIELLTKYLEVFAWTPYDMPGIDAEVACHRLNVDPRCRHVVQKGRRSSTQHVDAVIEEVEKLLDAGAIKEVHYSCWLSNPVVIKKKDGRWRVCVDFTDLNKAFRSK
ncbi:uncharacterized protein LOC130788661 [Actinidia eriantha]|uniref:uncharacterized protein LOC130788661 n=1 Tax=Actinidia eriantha TaxID=165200 RepID=UPI00258AA120|nr:uncharacterized protein LOC130788661 [Actinidia eriantha]